jgi:hypothetical protein
MPELGLCVFTMEAPAFRAKAPTAGDLGGTPNCRTCTGVSCCSKAPRFRGALVESRGRSARKAGRASAARGFDTSLREWALLRGWAYFPAMRARGEGRLLRGGSAKLRSLALGEWAVLNRRPLALRKRTVLANGLTGHAAARTADRRCLTWHLHRRCPHSLWRCSDWRLSGGRAAVFRTTGVCETGGDKNDRNKRHTRSHDF